MATLEKIRSKGPLLVIVIGLALFAFIAGDMSKIFQPKQQHDAGEINGEAISTQEFQQMVDEYAGAIKFSNRTNSLSDEQMTQIKDQVWQTYVRNKLIENEAEKLGLTVTTAEVQAIINAGAHPRLQQTPFTNPQTGQFDKDMLKKFLVDYSKMDKATTPAQYLEYYESINNFWLFTEKELTQQLLAEKYQNLISKALLANPIEAQASFDARVNQTDLLVAAVPYTSIVDSTITVSDDELKALYKKKKEQFKQLTELRDIKYIDVQVIPSTEDRSAIAKEVEDFTTQLGTATDIATFIRSTGSVVPFADIYYSKTALPTDIVNRIDSTVIGDVYGPFYTQADDSYNTFKIIGKQNLADSIQYRQIPVGAENEEKTKVLADSIFNALKAGADFAELAKKYSNGQANGEPNWITSNDYESGALDANSAKYINALNNAALNEFTNVNMGQGNVIFQVVAKKANKDKYKIAIIKRAVDFSKETYNKAYNEFSQFIASNPTLDTLVKNAEESGYKLLERAGFSSDENMVGSIKGSKEALRWIFNAKAGEVSPLYECGNNDRLLVASVSSINKKGYQSINAVKDQLKAEIIKDKKAEKIMSDIKAKNITSFAQTSTIANVVTDSVKHVTFAAPTYVAAVRSSEPALGAYASIAEINKVSAPIKGNGGIFVFQVYAKDKINETFDAKTEEETLQNMQMRTIGSFISDLYMNGKVVDTRYLFF